MTKHSIWRGQEMYVKLPSMERSLGRENLSITGKSRPVVCDQKGRAEFLKDYTMDGREFPDVHVVTLELSWGLYCGSLCIMFTRKKGMVVFDKAGKIQGVFLDGKAGAWVT